MTGRCNDQDGGQLSAQLVVGAYLQGFFPMGDPETGQVHWYHPMRRAVLPMREGWRSRSVARAVKRNEFEIRSDTAFRGVMEACAGPRSESDGVWITEPIKRVYGELFENGLGHSVEAWDGDRLVGGIYGLAIGGAFFGESMFSHRPNASKVALWHLVAHLRRRGYVLFDAQYLNEHTRRLGFVEIDREEYLTRLCGAVMLEGVTWGDFEVVDGR